MDRQTLYAPEQGNARAKKGEWAGRGVGVRGYGGLLVYYWKCKCGKYLIKMGKKRIAGKHNQTGDGIEQNHPMEKRQHFQQMVLAQLAVIM